MPYPKPVRPGTASWTTTDHWVNWLLGIPNRYLPVRCGQLGVCNMCWGPTPNGPDGTPYARCNNCRTYGHLGGVIPIICSWQRELEAVVHWAKEGEPWLNTALTSELCNFLARHLSCIERWYGRIDVITMVPSHPSSRGGWDHLANLHSQARGWQQQWDLNVLRKVSTEGAEGERGKANLAIFEVIDPDTVRGKRVLLVDDTWTSGDTINSAAAALNAAAALKPIALNHRPPVSARVCPRLHQLAHAWYSRRLVSLCARTVLAASG